MDKLVDAINNFTINDAGCELNTATTSDTQGDLTSDPDTVTHASNRNLAQNLLSFRTVGEFSGLPLPMNPKIRLTPRTLLTPGVKEILVDATSGNVWTNRNPRRIIRTGIGGSIPISTTIHSLMSKYLTPYYSDSTGTRGTLTRIPIGNTVPPCGINVSPNIDDIRKSATSDLRNSNKLDT